MEASVRTGRRMALLCLNGVGPERLGPWFDHAAPMSLERNGLRYILLEPADPGAPEIEALFQPGSLRREPGIGVAVFPRDADDPESLCRAAASAARGVADPAGRSEPPHPVAPPEGGFELYYQPQVDLESGRVTAAEALARCLTDDQTSAAGGISSAPAGMHGGDGFWALERAVRDLVRWRDLGCPEIRVAINLAIDQVGAPELSGKIGGLLGANALPPGCLEVELTEQRPCLDHAAVSAALAPIRALGIRIALDDFSTGFASLSLFDRLALDTLKIDRSFVADLSHAQDTEDAERLVHDIIGLAHERDLRVVAEGVENEAQLATLKRLKCDACQGYLFSAPLPGESLGALLSTGRVLP